MSARDDGGPAFPSHGSMGEVVASGMTLRDYFAAKAMAAFLTTPGIWGPTFQRLQEEGQPHKHFRGMCGSCYDVADAMLKARQS